MGKKVIIFTGGGSGGHVIPGITLIKDIQKKYPDYAIKYIGGRKGIEKKLIKEIKIPYISIFTGKLRRYFSWENFLDIFKLSLGLLQGLFYLVRFSKKNCLIFSTGGFVSVPVVVAGFLTGKTIFIHEQTSRVGLANRISSFFAKRIFITFESSKSYFKKEKVVFSGYPLRDECFEEGIKQDEICGIKLSSIKKPILFATGGGNGSLLVNNLILKNKEILEKKFFIFHQVGKDFKAEFETLNSPNYQSFDFLNEGMVDLFKASTIVVSRAGAGTVSELMALGKPSLFIPLKIAQKNEQLFNADEARKKLGSIVIEEDELSDDLFLSGVKRLDEQLNEDGPRLKGNMAKKVIFEEIANFL